MSFSAYSVAVRLRLIENVTHGLTGMASRLAATGRSVDNLQGKLKTIGALAAGGAALIGVGAFGLHGLRAATEEAEKFQTQVANLRTLGIGEAATRDAVKFVKSMDIMGVSWTEKMKLFGEAQGIFRQSGLSGPAQLAAAKLATPYLAQMRFANAALHPDKAGQLDSSSLAMMRFVEMRGGLNSPQRFKQLADSGFKAIQASGGNVSWELYRQFLATGGVAAQGMSDTAMFGEMEPVIGELKSRAGTAYMTAFNRLNGLVKLPNQVAHDLVKAGIWDGSKIEWNSQGGVKQFHGNPLKDAQTFHTSQFQWYKANILPWYAREHMTGDQMDREDALIGGRTGGMLFSIFRRQQHVIEQSVHAQAAAMTPAQAAATAARTMRGRRLQVGAQWANVKEAAGEAILPLAVSALSALIPVLKSIADFSIKHPGMFKALILGFAGLSVMAVVGGYCMLLRSAFMALGLVMSLVGGGGGALQLVGAGFRMMAPWLIRLVPWVLRGAAAFLEFIGPIGWTILAITALIAFWPQITAMFKGIKNWLSDLDIFHRKPGHGWNDVKPNFAPGQPEQGPSRYVPTSGDMKAFAVHGTVHIDGKKVGAIVSGHQAKAIGQTQVGVVRHDPGATPAAPGAGATR